jgi:hypothetical protein
LGIQHLFEPTAHVPAIGVSSVAQLSLQVALKLVHACGSVVEGPTQLVLHSAAVVAVELQSVIAFPTMSSQTWHDFDPVASVTQLFLVSIGLQAIKEGAFKSHTIERQYEKRSVEGGSYPGAQLEASVPSGAFDVSHCPVPSL